MVTVLKEADCTKTETCVLIWYSQQSVITDLFLHAFGMVKIGFGTVKRIWLGQMTIPKPA